MRIPSTLLLLVCTTLGLGTPANARELIVDLSKTVVPITTSFTGSDLLLFGSFISGDNNDIIIVVRGPHEVEVVRRKERVMGVWANGDKIAFENVPSFYYVASNRPIEDILDKDTAKRLRIGIDNLAFKLKNPDQVADSAKKKIEEFRSGLIQAKQRKGLFGTKVGQVTFKDGKLFRSDLHFPANVPVGEYAVEVYVFRDNQMIEERTSSVWVQKFGVEASIYNFAHQYALFYGIIAIILATAAGWLASVIFRKT